MTTVAQSTTSYTSGERRFLKTAFGTQDTISATLLMSDFTEGTHFPDGFILAGQGITQNAGGTYFKPTTGITPGANVYIVLSDTPVPTGATHVGVGGMTRGDIVTAALPEVIHVDSVAVAVAAGFNFY